MTVAFRVAGQPQPRTTVNLRMPSPPSNMDPDMLAWAMDFIEACTKNFTAINKEGEFGSQPRSLPAATVAQLTGTAMKYKPVPAGRMVFCVDDVGGSVPAFSDETGVWRRVTDRAVVSL